MALPAYQPLTEALEVRAMSSSIRLPSEASFRGHACDGGRGVRRTHADLTRQRLGELGADEG